MKKSRILDDVHETVSGLHRTGLLDKQTMREFDVLCLPPVRFIQLAGSIAGAKDLSGRKAFSRS